MSDLLLSVEQVEVVYHDVVTAVQGVNLTARAGQIVCLLGSNGAGKTTTLRAISGFIGLDHARVTGGRIVFAGEDIANAAPHICARAGIALVAERDKVFEQLSVRENLEIGMVAGKTGSQAAGGDRLDLKGIYRFFPELERLTGRQAGYLSGGERQMLAIGSALLTSPRLLLIDELSLAAPKTKEMATILSALQLGAESTLVATCGHDANVYKSARNIAGVSVAPVAELNALSVLAPSRLLVTKAALDDIRDRAAAARAN